MGIPDADWKLVDWNRTFEIAPTYPPLFCLPQTITIEEIKAVADFRRYALGVTVNNWKIAKGEFRFVVGRMR
jgi:hypothetical protein